MCSSPCPHRAHVATSGHTLGVTAAGRMLLASLWVKVREAAAHPLVPRTALGTPNYLAHVSSASLRDPAIDRGPRGEDPAVPLPSSQDLSQAPLSEPQIH